MILTCQRNHKMNDFCVGQIDFVFGNLQSKYSITSEQMLLYLSEEDLSSPFYLFVGKSFELGDAFTSAYNYYRFFDQLETPLGYKQMEDWYNSISFIIMG